MDAYLPVHDTVKPSLTVLVSDHPWRSEPRTQTLVWYMAPRERVSRGLSSTAEIKSFLVIDSPALAGLERLRTFKGWGDNWDAEGAKAPNPDVVDFASKVFGLLSVYRTPEVGLSSDGYPMFIYGQPYAGEILVSGPSSFDYFFANDDACEGEDVSLEDGALPAKLVASLHTA